MKNAEEAVESRAHRRAAARFAPVFARRFARPEADGTLLIETQHDGVIECERSFAQPSTRRGRTRALLPLLRAAFVVCGRGYCARARLLLVPARGQDQRAHDMRERAEEQQAEHTDDDPEDDRSGILEPREGEQALGDPGADRMVRVDHPLQRGMQPLLAELVTRVNARECRRDFLPRYLNHLLLTPVTAAPRPPPDPALPFGHDDRHRAASAPRPNTVWSGRSTRRNQPARPPANRS